MISSIAPAAFDVPRDEPARPATRLPAVFAFAAIVAMTPNVEHARTLATSEPRETDTGLAERWPTSTVTVVLDPSLEDLAPGATDAVRQALGTWVGGIDGLPNVVFEIGTSRATAVRDGKSIVLAAPITTPGQENALALTTTYAADDTGNILEADIVFNTNYAYAVMPAPSATCALTYDVGAVATHESGHFFGLGEDYTGRMTTMFVTTDPCDAHKRVLTSDDTSALAAMYAPPTSLVAHCDAAPSPRGDGMFGFFALALAFVAKRIRARTSS